MNKIAITSILCFSLCAACTSSHRGDTGPGYQASVIPGEAADTVPVDVTIEIVDEPVARSAQDRAGVQAAQRLSVVLGGAALGGVIGTVVGLSRDCKRERCPPTSKTDVTNAVSAGVVGAGVGALAGFLLHKAAD